MTAVPLAMVNNQYFDEFTNKVRVKPLPWEGYSRAGLITSTELIELKEFQHALNKQKGEEESALAQYIPLLVRLAEKLSSIDALQYLLVMLDDLVDRGHAAELNETITDNKSHILYKCLEKRDDYLGLKAAKILTGLMVGNGSVECRLVLAHLDRCLRSTGSAADVALQVMQSVLRVPRTRDTLYKEFPGCTAQIIAMLSTGRAPQTQYEVCFILWLLTFEPHIARRVDKDYNIVPHLVEIARSAVKEKVVRMVVSVWANLAHYDTNLPNMLVAKVPGCLETLSMRNFKDEDLKQDIGGLLETVGSQVMTTWDEYVNEVKSARLEWSPAHRSEQFWRININRMDENDHFVVRRLASVLESPTAGETQLAVACHDIAQYVKFNPEGKRVLARIGAKTRVMGLMTSEFAEVRYEALMCVQQMMLNAWRH
ncbi:H(+)-transporting V1 sector ATPase subunit H [Coemansia spiralis]|uniref:V-type proton ATPase subunit H n=2 Tax=Coemansia TaxID=4863 RepID=A0A9W8G8K0_9FUNG|nr:armadillo-type protein [Coemansia spiralis]KAJ1989996.1 H(+)-transporting V1 sector ATPase subunit H [Coemansia umbellata]KAJ2621511.1 H(+)-transporting V1 sector ATPase subunit H [Coemansia sp. RSA 1358]KAJ2677187.1 H(+)-transporting V1 sector ATPase subunit H [Coemansia spiralis]